MGKLGINSDPQGARIYINDKDTGKLIWEYETGMWIKSSFIRAGK